MPAWARGAALVVLALVAYLPALRAGFLWDDVSTYIVDNPLLRLPDGLFRFWFTTQAIDYYPLTNSLFWLEWRLFGEQPAGYHLVAIVLHGAGSMLLWRVLVRLAVPGAWVAAALFTVHPVNVESVAWISQTKNTLSLALFLAALLAWLHDDLRRDRRRYGLALVLFLLAVLAKTSAVTLPAVLLVCAWWRHRRVTRRHVTSILPFVVAGAALGILSLHVQARTEGAAQMLAEPFVTRSAAAGWIVWFYVSKALFPAGLTLVYPRWSVDAASPLAWLPNLAVLAVLAVAWRFRARWGRPVLAGFGVFLLNLTPVLGWTGIGFMAQTRVTDHWQYASLAALVALGAGAAARGLRSAKRRVLGIGLASAAILAGAVLTWRQANLYVDEERLWRDNLAKNPRAWVAHHNLGTVLAQEGRHEEAAAAFAAALDLMPDYGDAHVHLANVLDELGRTEEARKHYEHALRVKRPDSSLHYNIAVMLEKSGDLDGAAEHAKAAVDLRPDDAALHRYRAAILERAGRSAEALPHYRACVRLQPDDLYSMLHLAWGLMQSAEPRPQEIAEALEMATRVCQATDFQDPGPLEVLSLAQARAGRLDEATRTARQALEHAGRPEDAEQAARIAARLQEYEKLLQGRE